MKIENLKINGFGNIQNKEIILFPNINIIFGNNESGKSTLLKFIPGMLYGINRNKNGKEISDYEKYKPWNTEEYSGKLSYRLENGEYFEIYRKFSSKAPKVYNEQLEDITVNFKTDKARGSNFFKEQTEVEEELLMSTNVIAQTETKLEKPKQNLLIQQITNIISSGEENSSYIIAKDKLAKKILDEVGTQRTFQKPINIISEKLEKLKNEKKYLEENKINKIKTEENIEKIKTEEKNKKIELEIIKEIKKIKQEENIEEEKIKINENNLEEIFIKKEELNEKQKNKTENKKINNIFYLFLGIIFSLTVVSFLINFNNLIKYFLLIINIFYLTYLFFKINKNKKQINKKIKEENKIKKENNLLENLINEKKEEIEKIKNKKQEKITIEKINLKNKYNLSQKIIEDYFACNLIELENIIETKELNIKTLELKLYENKLENKSIEEKLENLVSIEEELYNTNEKKQELIFLSNSIQLASQILDEAYEEMKEKIIPEFTSNLSKATKAITFGKYQKVNFNDTEGLLVEKNDGDYVKAENLSQGTIDQMYLALRLSIAEKISKEPLPIILDETFAYYDANRLKNTLQYLSENYKNHQIIILTCSTREKEALEELKIEYNEIKL